jgi:uncharacterized protein GlcG (DUF336 family)
MSYASRLAASALLPLLFTAPASAQALLTHKPESAYLKQIPNVVAVGGGVPIKAGNEVIGAVGVSGAPGGEKDEVCANAGIAKVAGSLQ